MDASINSTAKCWSVWAYFSSFDPLQGAGNQSNNKKKRSDKEENDVDDDEDGSMSVDSDDDAYYDEDALELVGFISVIRHFGTRNIKMDGGMTQFHFREHRTVILPSYQGLGFGARVADTIG